MNRCRHSVGLIAGMTIGTLAGVISTGCSVESRQEPPATSVAHDSSQAGQTALDAPSHDKAVGVSDRQGTAAGTPSPAASPRPLPEAKGAATKKRVPPVAGPRLIASGAGQAPAAPRAAGAAAGRRSATGGAPPPAESHSASVDRPAAAASGDSPHTLHSLRKKPVDPVKANGPIFVDWPRPELAILISGELIGYLEPCGCAGLENQKGGLKRRQSLVKQLQKSAWPLVMVDLGGQVRRFGPQPEIKFRKAIESLVQIGYRAVGFGPQDLRLPVEQLVYVASNLPEKKNPFVSANVGLLSFDNEFVAPLRVIEAGGMRVGVTAILGTTAAGDLKGNDDIKTRPPAQGLAKVAPQLRKQADFLILLSHAPVAESKALARKFPDFNLVVTAGGAAEPPGRMTPIDGTKARLIEVGHKGMYVAVVGLYNDPQRPLRYQRVPIDARFPDSPEMQAMMVDYQKELATLGLNGLGLKPTPHPSGRKFVGSQRCNECHTEAAAVWEQTPHAHATATLVKLDPPRHHDPECLSCHVTGWDPQEFFPFVSGYLDRKRTGHLQNVGCENCHGPGSDHAAAEEGDKEASDEQLEKCRAQMRLVLREGEAEGKVVNGKVVQGPVTLRCYECHDLDNSPDFDFVKYWPHVEHHGTD